MIFETIVGFHNKYSIKKEKHTLKIYKNSLLGYSKILRKIAPKIPYSDLKILNTKNSSEPLSKSHCFLKNFELKHDSSQPLN